MGVVLCPWRVAGSGRAAGDPARSGGDRPGTRYPWTDLDGRRLCPEGCPAGSTTPSPSPSALTVLARPVLLVVSQESRQKQRDEEQETRDQITHIAAIEWLVPVAYHLAERHRSARTQGQNRQDLRPAVGALPPNGIPRGEHAKPETALKGGIGSVHSMARDSKRHRNQHARHQGVRPECEIENGDEGGPASVRQMMTPRVSEQTVHTRNKRVAYRSVSGVGRQERCIISSAIRAGTAEVVWVGSVGLLAGAASSTRLMTRESAQAVGPCQGCRGERYERSGTWSAAEGLVLMGCRRALGSE